MNEQIELNGVGSDSCIVQIGQNLRDAGITGFYIDIPNRRSVLSIGELRCLVYNPIRNTITFCRKDADNQPLYSTYRVGKINLTTISKNVEPVIEEAQRLITDD